MQKYHINLNMNRGFTLKQYYKDKGINNYIHYCWTELQNDKKNPLLRNYKMYKLEFGMEKYPIHHIRIFHTVTHTHYRTAITRLRTSSHTLEIEPGRYTVPPNDRLRSAYKIVENEAYSLLICEQHKYLRNPFYKKVAYRNNCFTALSDHDIYIDIPDDEWWSVYFCVAW